MDVVLRWAYEAAAETQRGRLPRDVAARRGLTDGAASAYALLSDVLGHVPTLQRTCLVCGGPHGKPRVDGGPHVSLSYAGGLVAVAVCAGAPVGVDVEVLAATAFDGFADVALAPDEVDGPPAHRARLWVRKEAALKADGRGLSVDPRTVDVRRQPVVLPGGVVQVSDIAVPDGWAGAVAVVGTVPATVLP